MDPFHSLVSISFNGPLLCEVRRPRQRLAEILPLITTFSVYGMISNHSRQLSAKSLTKTNLGEAPEAVTLLPPERINSCYRKSDFEKDASFHMYMDVHVGAASRLRLFSLLMFDIINV